MRAQSVFALIILLCIGNVCGGTSPLFVGGLFQTIGSSENLHSFGEYFPSTEDWSNLDDSAILSTGTAQAVALVESTDNQFRGFVVGGVFNYLNHTSNSISFGNIAFFNESANVWEPLGWGCNGPVTSLVVVPIQNSPCTLTNPCFTVVAAGAFSVCFQGDEDRTTISYPNGFGFFDLGAGKWYKPVNQSLPIPMQISSLSVSNDNIVLYLTGNAINVNVTVGSILSTKIMVTDTIGQISNLKWELLASTPTDQNSLMNTVIPASSGSLYVGGLFENLILGNGTEIQGIRNIAYYNSNEFLKLEGGTNGEVVSGTIVTTTKPPILYIAGNFSSVSGVLNKNAKNIARWNGLGWDDLGGGITLNSQYKTPSGSPFLQIQAWESNVLVGGAFIQAGSTPVDNIALWDGSRWSALPNDDQFSHYRMLPFSIAPSGRVFFAAQGLENSIFEDIIIDGYPLVENLMVEFSLSGSVWSNYNYNELLLDGVVLTMEFFDESTLIVGGGFRKVGTITNLNNLVLLRYPKLDWSPFDGGVYGLVTSLQVVDTSVFVGGLFHYIGNSTKFASIAKYCDETGWENVGDGISHKDPSGIAKRPIVYDLSLSTDSKFLYAGGTFMKNVSIDGVYGNVTSLVGWDIQTKQWFAVQQGMKGIIYDLEITSNNNLYVGGSFEYLSAGITYNNFAKLQLNQTSVSSPLSVVPTCSVDFGECETQMIFTIALDPTVPYGNKTGSPVYIGGVWDNIQAIVMNNVARLVNDAWVTLGSGGVTGASDTNAFVMSLTLTRNYQDLYIGGYFSTASSIPVNDIVSWSISDLQFNALAPVEGWQGYIFDILPTRNITLQSNETPAATGNENIRPVSIGLILSLVVTVFCLLFIILAILFAVIKYRPSDRRFPNPEDSSLSQAEKETWEDFYSYEWEVSYNLLEISEAVGRGRNGIVHSAHYKGQNVAVKIFNAEITGTYYTKDNVCKYASVMRAFNHPNIVHMVGASSDPLCLVTEFGELGCLSDIIRISPSKLTWARIKSISLEAARGMSFLHGQEPPFLHQNLSSNNIMINEFWSVKICDAGLTSVLKESGEYKISYSKRWSAPEVLLGRAYTTKADVYSFGMILYHMITQSVPYTAEEKETNVTLAQLIIRGVRPIIPVDIPNQFGDVLRACWREVPEERPSFTSLTTTLNNIPDELLTTQ